MATLKDYSVHEPDQELVPFDNIYSLPASNYLIEKKKTLSSAKSCRPLLVRKTNKTKWGLVKLTKNMHSNSTRVTLCWNSRRPSLA